MSVSPQSLIAVTGATGQLGQRVVSQLLKVVPASSVVALVRTPAKAVDLGVRAVEADYTKPATLASALAGVTTLLLISSNSLDGRTGQRILQHRSVIDAAKAAGVQHIAYTSVLFASTSPLGLAKEHSQTEQALKDSGIPYTALRNGWYNENFTASLDGSLAAGGWIGAAGDAKFSAASRDDFAAAAVAVITAPQKHVNATYELAGDSSFTLTELAAEVSKQSGKNIPYINLSEADLEAALVKAGLPQPLSALLADSDVGASKGGLFSESKTLSELIGRPTTPFSATLAAALNKA